MSIFRSIFAATSDVSDFLNPKLWLTDSFGGRRTASGEAVGPVSAMGLSAYFGAIRVLSEDVGKLPLIVYKRLDPRGKERDKSSPAYKLLHDAPNDEMSAMTFRELLTQYALGHGNGYAMIEMDGGTPTALIPIHPARVTPRREDGRIVYRVRQSGMPEQIEADEMLHIRGMGDDLCGYSICRLAAESIGVGLATQKFGGAYFGNGMTMSGVLTHPGNLGEKALANLKKSMKEMYAGSENAFNVFVAEEGMKWEKMSVPPDEAQFIETRQFQVEEICRWFRMPPHKVQHLLRATFNNIEQQSIEYVTDTLMPWLVRWEQEINRKLMPRDGETFAEHLVNGLLRGDAVTRATYYTQRFRIGTLSQNDIRELENENPIGEEGDKYMVSGDMRTEAERQGTATPAQPPARSSAPRVIAGVLSDACARIVSRENLAMKGAAASRKPDQFATWAAEFYRGHRQYVIDALRPLAVLFADLLGQATDTLAMAKIEELIAAFADSHCGLAVNTLPLPSTIEKAVEARAISLPAMMTGRFIDAFTRNGHEHS